MNFFIARIFFSFFSFRAARCLMSFFLVLLFLFVESLVLDAVAATCSCSRLSFHFNIHLSKHPNKYAHIQPQTPKTVLFLRFGISVVDMIQTKLLNRCDHKHMYLWDCLTKCAYFYLYFFSPLFYSSACQFVMLCWRCRFFNCYILFLSCFWRIECVSGTGGLMHIGGLNGE